MENESSFEGRMKLEPEKFAAILSSEEKMLIKIRDELYEGSWDYMKQDLENRLAGKPYIFKLVSRIEHDLQAVEMLMQYEKQKGVNLADF
jgi:hypothetical protein